MVRWQDGAVLLFADRVELGCEPGVLAGALRGAETALYGLIDLQYDVSAVEVLD